MWTFLLWSTKALTWKRNKSSIEHDHFLSLSLWAGKEFPNSFESLVKKICKYLFHVLAHIYSSHFKETLALELHGHLNTLYTHFILFIREFNLVDPKETTIMDDLTEVLCTSSGSSSNGSGNGSSGNGSSGSSAGAQNHVKERWVFPPGAKLMLTFFKKNTLYSLCVCVCICAYVYIYRHTQPWQFKQLCCHHRTCRRMGLYGAFVKCIILGEKLHQFYFIVSCSPFSFSSLRDGWWVLFLEKNHIFLSWATALGFSFFSFCLPTLFSPPLFFLVWSCVKAPVSVCLSL